MFKEIQLKYGCVSARRVQILSLHTAAFWGAGWSNGKMKRHKLIAASVVALLICCDYAAALVFNDGGTHIINYAVYEPVYVDQSAPGVRTKVDLLGACPSNS